LDVDEAGRHGKAARVDDFGGRVVDARRDGGNAAIADRDIDGLARGSRAVEEKTAADQDVMARAQSVTGPLSSTPLPSGSCRETDGAQASAPQRARTWPRG